MTEADFPGVVHRDTKLLQQEREDLALRGPILLEIALKHLSGTALVTEKQWEEHDALAIRSFFLEAAPYAHPKVYPVYWEHILLAALMHRKLAERVGLDPIEAYVVGLGHDGGRLAVPHHYMRNDVVLDWSVKALGVRPTVLEKLYPLDRLLGAYPKITSIDDLTLPQIINDLGDNFAKRTENGKMFTLQDILALWSRQQTRYPSGLLPGERHARKKLVENGGAQFYRGLVEQEVQLLKDRYGVDFEMLSAKVLAEFQQPENQAWLLAVKHAQETLDRKVDERLGRPPIKTVIFDIGKVLIGDVDHIFQPTAGMQELVRELPRQGIRIVLLSDEIAPLAPAVKRAVGTLYPDIRPEDIFISSEIHAAKREEEAPALGVVLEKLGITDPGTVLFVDDNSKYTTQARARYGMRALTFEGNPFQGTSAVERLRNELQRAEFLS